MRKIWDIPGGIHPPENKTRSLQSPIAELPLPNTLLVPLNQHLGAPAKPCVAVGDQVLKGQKIGEASSFVSAAVHAPSSGVVTAIEERQIAHPSGMSALCIEIRCDGEEQWIAHSGCDDFHALQPRTLLNMIADAGIAGMGGAGFPSAVKLNPGAQRPIGTLIINATECEPYITADDILIRERAAEIIQGVEILRHILGNPGEVLIGIEDNKPQAFEALSGCVGSSGIEVVEFPTKYPSGGEKQLIQILTGKEVPSGGLPADIGIVCQNIGTTYAIKRAVIDGEPLISRITTVTGDGCSTNGNYQVLIGTPISHLLLHNGFDAARTSRVVMGGPMMGFALPSVDVPVVKTTNCILTPSHEEIPAEQAAHACIRCGLCAEACPASLLPQQLFWHAQSQNQEKLEAHNLFDCIECGACSYVCPSNIPLVQYFRAGKGDIRKTRAEKTKADFARERFEFRTLRLEKAEQEKEAKRAARRAAAEQAKASPSADSTAGSAADIIKAAQERAAARQASPEQQLAKLQRGVTTAQNRLAIAEEKLAAASTEPEEKRSALEAAVATAQQKLSDAQRKLEQHDSNEAIDQAAAKISQKLTAPSHDLLQEKIATLQKRIADTEQKIAAADDDGLRNALNSGLEKMRSKLDEVEKQLAETDVSAAPDNSPQVLDAAAAAIERAKAAAAQRAGMSEQDKLRSDIESLQKRLAKAEQKRAAAETDNSEHLDALRNAEQKLRDKLAASQARLEEIS